MSAIINSTKNLWRRSTKLKDSSLNDGRLVTIAVIGCGDRGKVWIIYQGDKVSLTYYTGLLEIRPCLSRSLQNRRHCWTSPKNSAAFRQFTQRRQNSRIRYLAGTSHSICGNDQYHRQISSRCRTSHSSGSSSRRSCWGIRKSRLSYSLWKTDGYKFGRLYQDRGCYQKSWHNIWNGPRSAYSLIISDSMGLHDI